MNDDLVIALTAGLTATACGLLGPFLVLRRAALLSDAISHAVLPGIVATWLLLETRAPLAVIAGGTVFAVICVLAIEALRGTGLVRSDAAIGLVFPMLFALGVLGVTHWASDIHLDLDATIYGEIAFAGFDTWSIGGVQVARSLVILGAVAAANLAFIALLWRPLKATTFDPEFSQVNGLRPRLLSRALLVVVAITAVTAFESVGAILVVTLLIVPAASAYLLCERLGLMIVVALAIGWVAAVGGYWSAVALDTSIAGAMGLVCALCFTAALLLSPWHGLIALALRRRRRARVLRAALAAER